jgi:hypothetical protein
VYKNEAKEDLSGNIFNGRKKKNIHNKIVLAALATSWLLNYKTSSEPVDSDSS